MGSIPSLLSMFNDNTTSPAYVRSEYYISCPCPVSAPSLLPQTSKHTTSTAMFSQNTTSPMSSQYTISIALSSQHSIGTDHAPLLHHLYNLCQDSSTPSPQPMPNQYPIYTAHVQSLPHIYHQCPDSTHLYCPCPVRTSDVLPMSS